MLLDSLWCRICVEEDLSIVVSLSDIFFIGCNFILFGRRGFGERLGLGMIIGLGFNWGLIGNIDFCFNVKLKLWGGYVFFLLFVCKLWLVVLCVFFFDFIIFVFVEILGLICWLDLFLLLLLILIFILLIDVLCFLGWYVCLLLFKFILYLLFLLFFIFNWMGLLLMMLRKVDGISLDFFVFLFLARIYLVLICFIIWIVSFFVILRFWLDFVVKEYKIRVYIDFFFFFCCFMFFWNCIGIIKFFFKVWGYIDSRWVFIFVNI